MATNMQCPRCQGSLKAIIYEGVVIDTCQNCQGEWLDKDEILLINKAREVVFSKEEKTKVKEAQKAVMSEIKQPDKPINCPRCNVGLKVINYAYSTGILIDRCPKCDGIWLDKDELEQIQILIEEYEKQLPEIKAKFKPTLTKIKEKQAKEEKKQIEEVLAKRPKWRRSPRIIEPLLKAIIYKFF